MASNVSFSDFLVLFVSFVVRGWATSPLPIVGTGNDRGERYGEREPPMTSDLKSELFGGGPVTAGVNPIFWS